MNLNLAIGNLSNIGKINLSSRKIVFKANDVSDSFSPQNNETKKAALEKQLIEITNEIYDIKSSIQISSKAQASYLATSLEEELEKSYEKFQKIKDELVDLSLGDDVYFAQTQQEKALALDELIKTQSEKVEQLSKKISVLEKRPNADMPSQAKTIQRLKLEKRNQKEILRFYEVAKNQPTMALYASPFSNYRIKSIALNAEKTIVSKDEVTRLLQFPSKTNGIIKASPWFNRAIGTLETDCNTRTIVDVSNPKIYDVIDELNQYKNRDIVSKNQLSEQLEISGYGCNLFAKLARRGYIKPIYISGVLDEKPIQTSLYLKDDENNSKIMDVLLSSIPKNAYDDGDIVDITELSQHGYATLKYYANKYKEGKIKVKTKIVETQDGPKKQVFVKLSDLNPNEIDYLRKSNPNFASFSDLQDDYGLKDIDIALALIEGKLIPEEKYYGLDKTMYFDLRKEENAAFLAEVQFERDTQKTVRFTKKTYGQIRTKIAWMLSEELTKVKNEMLSNQPYIAKLIERKTIISKLLGEIEELEQELATKEDISIDKKQELQDKIDEMCSKINEIKLSKKEVIALKSFYKTLWKTCGTKEFSNNMKLSSEIIRNYKKEQNPSVLDNVECDKKIKREILKLLQDSITNLN